MHLSWMKALVPLFVLAAVGCGGDEAGTSAGGNGGSGNGGDATTASTAGNGGGTTDSTTAGMTTTTPFTTSFSTTSSTTTGPLGECDPPAPEGSLYSLTDIDLNDDVVSMCKYRGDVLLVVNTAEA